MKYDTYADFKYFIYGLLLVTSKDFWDTNNNGIATTNKMIITDVDLSDDSSVGTVTARQV